MEFTKHNLVATDGAVVTVQVPAGPMPTTDQVAAFAAAFDRVKNADHWKNPVNKTITVARLSEIDTITDAIEFYTATTATATVINPKTADGWRVHITAPGYFAGPAN